MRITAPFQPDPQQLGLAHHLGAPLAQHQQQGPGQSTRFSIGAFFMGTDLCIVGAVLVLALLLLTGAINTPNLHASPDALESLAGLCGVGLLLSLISFFVARTGLRVSGTWLYLYDEGMIQVQINEKLGRSHQAAEGSLQKVPTLHAIRWSDITEVRTQIEPDARILAGYQLRGRYGPAISYGKEDYHTFDQLAEQVEERLLASKMPEARARYMRQSPQQFGELTLAATGLHVQGRSLPWNEIAEIAFPEYRLLVSSYSPGQGKLLWYQANQENLPNLYLFKGVVQEFQPAESRRIELRFRPGEQPGPTED